MDLAVDTGGNVEGSKVDKVVDVEGVHVVGIANLPGRVAAHASQMYSSNLCNLVEHFWNDETKEMVLDMDDEIMEGCLVTHGGEIVNEMLKKKQKG